MCRCSEAVKADVRQRMGPPHRHGLAAISMELGIHVITLSKWRKAWWLQRRVGQHQGSRGLGSGDKCTGVLETAGLNATGLAANCPERGLFPEQKDLVKDPPADQREIKLLQQELRRMDKALAEAAALLFASQQIQAYWGEHEAD